jgi:hypothetical protein
MWKRIAVVGATAAIIGGAGTAAYAATGTPTPSPSSPSISSVSTTSAITPKTLANKHRRRRNRIRRSVHATWVTENAKTKTFTTHDAIRGHVTSVSATSITVQAADNVTETYGVTLATKVRTRTLKTTASIADVRTGDPVFVGGTGIDTLTAIRVIDVKK